MDGEERRRKIIAILKESEQAIAGTELAGRLGVTRQVVVQDIALLRAGNKNILSTNKGYLLYDAGSSARECRRTMKVVHANSRIREELYIIVDNGGRTLDVVVEHPIYGQITVDLFIRNRLDADNFVRAIQENQTRPLNGLTMGVHYHTIAAESEEILDRIEKKLEEQGFLLKND